jgi:hypothetical protein
VLTYVRFQSAVPNRYGRFPGVFAMANGLARSGRLNGADHEWWRTANAEMDTSYADPTAAGAGAYDRALHSTARGWFKAPAAGRLLDLTRGYLDLLDRYEVPWTELRTISPGRIHYEDAVQVVASPYRYPDDWPLHEVSQH